MGEDFVTPGVKGSEKGVKGSERTIALVAEEGASLSSGSLRLYYLLPSPSGEGSGVRPMRPVGCIDLYNYDPLNRRCAVGIMVASEHRRQGHALAMLRALETLYSPTQPPSNSVTQQPSHPATQPLSNPATQPPSHSSPLHTLYADIAATNAASLALFAKAGYTECGHFRDWLAIPLRPSATSPKLGEEPKNVPDPQKENNLTPPPFQGKAPEGITSLNSPPFQGKAPEGITSLNSPPSQGGAPEGITSLNSPPFQGGAPEGEGGVRYIDTIRMQKILQ